MRIKIISSSLFASLFIVFTFSVNAQVSSITGTRDSAVITQKQRQGITREENDLRLKNRLENKSIMVCAQDVKQCPDGSYVSRQPPTCVFAPCSQLKDKIEEFKEKLQIIRDGKKRVLVERIDERISAMNKNHTKKLLTVVEKLEAILNKISDRAEKLKEIPAGLKTTAVVDSAISGAKSAIDAAKAAVAIQSAKVYSIEVINDSTLRSTVGSVVSMFRKDLRDVHKAVIDAKQAVQKAEKELAKVRGEKMEKAGEK